MNKLVLIVEDSPEIREGIADVLEHEGFSAAHAEDGLSALMQLRSGLKPDLILLDLMMPRMGGLEFHEEQLRDPGLADIPVVVMTATRMVDPKALHLEHVLLKPFGPGQLLDAIAAAQK